MIWRRSVGRVLSVVADGPTRRRRDGCAVGHSGIAVAHRRRHLPPLLASNLRYRCRCTTQCYIHHTVSSSRPCCHVVAKRRDRERDPWRRTTIQLDISSFVSVGNKADVSSNDLLQYWEEDSHTNVILLYIESFGNPRRFARIARPVSRGKPIISVKAGDLNRDGERPTLTRPKHKERRRRHPRER